MKVPKELGMTVMAAWLILFGLLTAPFLSDQLRPQRRCAGHPGDRCGRHPLHETVVTPGPRGPSNPIGPGPPSAIHRPGDAAVFPAQAV
jgi:hypothetical protein